jgi:hypothetical protein
MHRVWVGSLAACSPLHTIWRYGTQEEGCTNHSLIHSFIDSFIHSFIDSFIH